MKVLTVKYKHTRHALLKRICLFYSFCAYIFLFDDFTCLKPNMRTGHYCFPLSAIKLCVCLRFYDPPHSLDVVDDTVLMFVP